MISLTECNQTGTAGKPDDDEFFDRVQSNRHRRQARIALGGVKSAGDGAGAAGGAGGAAGAGGRKGAGGVVTAVDLLEERHGLQERLREVEGQVAEERRRREEASGEGVERVEGGGEGEGVGGEVALDPLDAFMSAVTTKIEMDKLGTLTREAARLSGELERVAALLQLADPSGEAEAKRSSRCGGQKEGTSRGRGGSGGGRGEDGREMEGTGDGGSSKAGSCRGECGREED
ncbi:unnamed protein product [Closterium sp. Naga37s-1]|nr:unnamed protein product [Closterium sp. Naga37s-1]